MSDQEARQYPVLDRPAGDAVRPLSFVVVHYSDELFQNLLRSDCVHDPLNQLVTIDNRQNLFFESLSKAINAGIDRSQHELVVVAHEDVLLPQGWQQKLERSLDVLEAADPGWGMAGSVGWTPEGAPVGHWSDPREYRNTFRDSNFEPVGRLDEQLLILRRSTGVRLDDQLPSIHNIGLDLAQTMQAQGLQTYAVDAPTIHKYADKRGELIVRPRESPKLWERHGLPFRAGQALSDEYIRHKWSGERTQPVEREHHAEGGATARLDSPVIFWASGDLGSALAYALADDAGAFLGNEISQSGHTLELAMAVHEGVLASHQACARWQVQRAASKLREAAAEMLAQGSPSGLWGFHVPEAVLMLPGLQEAFPDARVINLLRDPASVCLEEPPAAARLDNPIGQVALRAAYRHAGASVGEALDNLPTTLHARAVRHQLETVIEHGRSELGERYLEVRFEEMAGDAGAVVRLVADWLQTEPTGKTLARAVKRARRSVRRLESRELEPEARAITEPLRARLGYAT